MPKIPLLTANDIECRMQQISKNKSALILLYKNARVDMRILDDVFGEMNWQRKHEIVNGNLFCTISIWDKEKAQWVSKQDVGVPSHTEAEKGQASDSFKRAGTCWGIGRELYDTPPIWIKLNDSECAERNGKITSYAKFYVKSIAYDEKSRKFTDLTIVDEKGNERYSLTRKTTTQPKYESQKPVQAKQKPKEEPATKNDAAATAMIKSNIEKKAVKAALGDKEISEIAQLKFDKTYDKLTVKECIDLNNNFSKYADEYIEVKKSA